LRCLYRDNAGENVSRVLEAWLLRYDGLRSDKLTPHEPFQNGKAGNHIEVLCNIASTIMVASGLTADIGLELSLMQLIFLMFSTGLI
jgi:hypothetical protein